LDNCAEEANRPTSSIISMKSLEEYLRIAEGLNIPPDKLAVAKEVLRELSTRDGTVIYVHLVEIS